MNFLRQSFTSISEPASHNSSNPLSHAEADRDAALRATPFPASAAHHPSSSLDSDSDDARLMPPPSASAIDSLRTRNRIAIEDHIDVPDDGGGILIPSRELPTEWHAHGNMTSLMDLDRGYVFPGERVSIVVYVSSHDPSMPEIITPFRVAAMMEKVNQGQKEVVENTTTSASHDSLEARDEGQKKDLAAKEVELSSFHGNPAVGGMVLMTEEHKNRSAALLHMFQSSHFFARISGTEEEVWKKEKISNQVSEELDDGTMSTSSLDQKRFTDVAEPVPIIIEGGDFDPRKAGGVARNARCYSFDNGDIAVILQVTVATDLKGDVVLEVLQFEQPGKLGTLSGKGSTVVGSEVHQISSNTTEQLLQWLIPLDNPMPLPSPGIAASNSIANSSPQRPSLTGSSTSSLFSFANLRTYSSGSSAHSSFQSSIMATPPQLSSTHGLDEWERSVLQKSSKTHSSGGKEGLLSFRGAQLEPQRFSVHCGLEGLYIPGWRWRRKIEIVEPVSVESYFADCNTKDLICVSVENVVPAHFPEILVLVDSISIVCQTAQSGSVPSSVPIACIEVGENHKLPGLSLRPGEQHSFILKPSSSMSHALVNDKVKGAPISNSYGHDSQATNVASHASLGNGKKRSKDNRPGFSQDSGSYVIVISCRCSHTESRLHFKCPIKWQPRSPRDLLLSVSLDSVSQPEIPNGSLPSFVPKVVTVQATNLTSDSLHLTLLAPSSRYLGSSILDPVVASPRLPRISSFMSFHERKEWPAAKTNEDDSKHDKNALEASSSGRPSSLQRSLSLPPVKPIESIMGITPRVVKERAISAADIAAENSTARTHLWLQSIIPLGSVPSQSTTAIKCELLPLTDGIVTLDTLRISTKQRDVYYPEQPLQIYAMSSIGIGIP